MIALLLRLFALRPLLTMGILGFPVLLLIAVGLFTFVALKALVFVVLPAVVVIWLVRKAYKAARSSETMSSASTI